MNTLYDAAVVGDVKAIRRLLAAGTPPDTPGSYDHTPLMEAASNGCFEIVRLLLDAGADPRRDNSLALDFAVRLGTPEIVRALLEAGADPNRSQRDSDDAEGEEGQEEKVDLFTPPLLDAVHRGNFEIVQMLVEAGARVDVVVGGYGLLAAAITLQNDTLREYLWQRGASFSGALHAAAQTDDLATLDRLIAAGADIDARGGAGTPLVVAASAGRDRIVARLIEAGADLEQWGRGVFERTALGEAVAMNNLACTRLLLDAGASLNACRDSTLLQCAIETGRASLVRRLLRHGANPNETRGDALAPLFAAIQQNEPAIVKALLRHGADPNVRYDRRHRPRHERELLPGATPLMLAAGKRQRRTVEVLLAAGADATRHDPRGQTAADYAAAVGDTELTRRLQDAGAQVTIADQARHDAAILAAVRGNDVPGALAALAAGAKPNAADDEGCGALMEAAKRGQLPVVEALLQAGADPNQVAKWGESPLRVSVLRSQIPIVRALLAAGADVNARQIAGSIPTDTPNTVYYSGESALHDAATWGTLEILQLLLAAGADINFRGTLNQSPLVAAVNSRRMDAASLLLAAGAVVPPEDQIWVAPYRFAEAAESPAFQAFAAEVAATCGAPGAPIQHLPGALCFKLSLDERGEPSVPGDPVLAAREWGQRFARDYETLNQKADALLDRLAARAQAAGYLLLDAGKPIGCGPLVQFLALLPTQDKFEALAAFGVRGNDDELRTADIIAWFQQLDTEAPFELRGVKFDTVIIEFIEAVKEPQSMAERMCEICSDLAAGADGDRVEFMTNWLKSNRRVHFWWD